MDRTLTRAQLHELALKLLSPSRELDERRHGSFRQSIEALAAENKISLEALVSSSIPELPTAPAFVAPPEPAAAPADEGFRRTRLSRPAEQAFPTPAPSRPAPVRYETSNKEYRKALGDDSLVEALLSLQRQKSSRPSSKVLKPQTEGQEPAAAESFNGFSHARVPEVQVRPKPSSFQQRSPSQTRTLLRDKE